MRSKEDAQDYRYFPDPDLVPIHISDEWIEEIRSKQPEFRDEKRARYREEYQIPDYDIDIITNSKKLADIFEDTIKEHGLATVNDEGALKTACEAAIAGNSKAVEDYKGGKEKALGALVGQVMKAMKGKADPGSVNQMLR